MRNWSLIFAALVMSTSALLVVAQDAQAQVEPAAQPEAAQSEAAQPEASQPEAAQPEASQPEAAQPEASQPEAAQPEAAQPEAAQPEAAPSEPAQPEAAQPDAAPELATAENVMQTTVVPDLVNPSSIAVQPSTGHIFVSDSGAHRIIKFDPANPSEITEVVTGFTNDVYGKGPEYDIGPLGLLFLNQNTLVVGGGGKPDGEETVMVFNLPADGAALTADAAATTIGPIATGNEAQPGEGNFYALAATATSLFATSNGDDTKGWVLKASIFEGTATDLRTFIATKEAVDVDAPVAIAINPNRNGGHLVVGQMGEITIPNDSLLTFYHPDTGELMLKLTTTLHDIAGLAYAPNEDIRRLYAVDFAWATPAEGGVFRLEKTLDSNVQGVRAVRVATLEKPAAIAFGLDGAMYVAVFGASEDEAEKSGGIVKITGNF
jgi:DNA-binding beta-propeller fold protein YncE